MPSLPLVLCRLFSFVVHLLAFFIYGFILLWQYNGPIVRYVNPHASVAGDFKYLTYWNLLFQFLFFSFCLIVDLFPRRRISKYLSEKLDTFFHSVAFPLSMYVQIIFWCLYSIDKDLVMNRVVENLYPDWWNHGVHTIIGPIIVLESLFTYHKRIKYHDGIVIISCLYFAYFIWLIIINLYANFWVYPFIEYLSWPKRIILGTCSIALLSFFHVGGQIMHRWFWPDKRIQTVYGNN